MHKEIKVNELARSSITKIVGYPFKLVIMYISFSEAYKLYGVNTIYGQYRWDNGYIHFDPFNEYLIIEVI
jgi:hypothetical protein